MTEPTTQQTAGPLRLFKSGAAGYCDPVTGLCMLPTALPELRGDPETTTLPGHEEKAVLPGLRPVAD
jgi:hypothetical protein